MNEQVEGIKEKIFLLRNLDSSFTIFGVDTHRYSLNPVLTIEEIYQFQADNKVQLPKDYVEFLTSIGNGGVGPFYGVHSLNDSRVNFFDTTKNANHTYFDLSKAFPHTEHWNVEKNLEELYEKIEEAAEAGDEGLEEQLFKQKWRLIGGEEHDFGRLNISDYGCGLQISLIVNGEEKGNMWTDDRTNDGGLYPTIELGNKEKITFLDWYELWLDNSLEEIQNKTQN